MPIPSLYDLDGIIAGCFIKGKEAKLIFDMHEIYEVSGKLQGLGIL